MLYDEIKKSLEASVQAPDIDIYKRIHEILCRIVEIIKDESTDDPECFMRIDRLITLLNNNEIDTGTRHDFG